MNVKLVVGVLLLVNVQIGLCAEEQLHLGEPVFGGSGCLKGTINFALAPDYSTLSILFDDFKSEAGNGTLSEQKDCTVRIPVDIPSDHYLTLFKVEYRGFNSLPKGTSSEFSSEYDFESNPTQKRKHSKKFKGPLVEDFLEVVNDQNKSNCGGRDFLTIKTLVKVQTNSQQDQAFSLVDTKDIVSRTGKKDRKFHFRMNLKKCPKKHDRVSR